MSATTAEVDVRSPDDEAVERIRARLVRPLPADAPWGWVLPLVVTAVAGIMRFWHLARPKGVVFDEVYYKQDAWSLLHNGVELDVHDKAVAPACTSTHCGFVVHPPLGKWMIAVGEAIFGNTSFGWRFASAVVGTLAVLMIARIARRMFRSTALGVVAGLLLTFEGLEFVQSRTSMLDIFLMFWVLAAFGCLVLDRDFARQRLATRLTAPLSSGDRGPRLGFRPWRLAAAFCVGAAMATKWDGLFWLPVLLLLTVAWDMGARRTAGAPHPIRSALLRDSWPAVLTFVVVPVVVYVTSWTGWFVSDGAHAYDHDLYVRAGQSWLAHDRAVLRGWWHYHHEIYEFHRHLDRFGSPHPYLSRPYGWLLLARPVAYFYASPNTCGAKACSQEVLGVGSPAVWWASIPALLACGWMWVARRDWRAAAILVSFAAGYLPWFWADHDNRTMFLFYMLPAVPFMVLAVSFALGLIFGRSRTGWRRTVGAGVVAAYLVAVIGTFAWLRPVLAGDVITYDQWHSRMLFTTCDPAKHRNESKENAPCWI